MRSRQSIPVEFTAQALGALPCVKEIASALSSQPDLGEVIAGNHHLRQVVLFGFRVTYVVEERDILVITAREAE